MENLVNLFGMTAEQAKVLFSVERLIVENDIRCTELKKNGLINYKKQAFLKKEWLQRWEQSINDYLYSLEKNTRQILLRTEDEIKESIVSANKSETEIWKYLILLESVAYIPYYPLGSTTDELQDSKEVFKGLKLDTNKQRETLNHIASLLGIQATYVEKFEKALKESSRKISNFYTTVVVGVSVGLAVVLILLTSGGLTAIATIIGGAKGLTGAVAVNAGLAALGGGSIAAGGFGISGGIAVIVGGGSLIGVGAGGTVGFSIAQLNSGLVMHDAVKLEVVMKEILLAIQRDTKSFQEIINKLTTDRENLKIEVEKLKAEQANNRKKIQELEKSIKYLSRLINNLRK